MTRAFVHLSDLFGDHEDVLGVREGFRSLVETHRLPDEDVVIIEANTSRVGVTRESWADEQGFTVLSVDEIDWLELPLTEVDVDCTGVDRGTLKQLDRGLRSRGFVRGGRPWGEAGSSLRYVKPQGAADRLQALRAQARIRAGETIVAIRDNWLAPDIRTRLGHRFRARRSPHFSRSDLLDDELRDPSPSRPLRVNEIFSGSSRPASREWHISLATDGNPWELAHACFNQHGLWPISFSYPGRPLEVNPNPTREIADIVPGFPYSFEDESAYMRTYHQAYMGLTQRKAGWDCFRHVEIMAAGCVPLMPDAAEIPDFAMVHYPKAAMAVVAANVRNEGGVPDSDTRHGFREHFDRNLTSEAMARYVLRAAGLENAQRVLFIDAALPQFADYQSVLTLIGLKQLLGAECHVRHAADYIYSDIEGDLSHLYGRGFGYTRLLDPGARSSTERGEQPLGLTKFDALIMGSISRNISDATRLLREFAPERTIWIHGEDTPPTLQQARYLRESGTHTFIRSIHSKRR